MQLCVFATQHAPQDAFSYQAWILLDDAQPVGASPTPHQRQSELIARIRAEALYADALETPSAGRPAPDTSDRVRW